MIRAHALAVLASLTAASAWGSGATLEHERLRLRNTFKTPEEVVSYYCARDASGFVWSGLLESERTAFTAWSDVPQQDSFYIARRYEVVPAEAAKQDANSASVAVKYELTAVGDAHGTRTPPPRPVHVVTFDLKKIAGAWKIVKPDFSEIAPVVLESKFPYSSAR